MSDLEAQFERLRKAQWELYRSGQNRQAAATAREMGRIASSLGENGKLVEARFCEGRFLWDMGNIEAALPLLIEAANIQSPDVNPAETFNAMIAAIEIAAVSKRLAYLVDLVDRTQLFLERTGKGHWRHKIDSVHADIEFDRGRLRSAADKAVRAWNGYLDEYRHFTEGSHLGQLCKISFFLHDVAALERWTTVFTGRSTSSNEGDNLYRIAAQIWAIRTTTERSQGLELSRTLLRRAFQTDNHLGESARCGLRMLVLNGAFEEAERWWSRFGERNERKKLLDYADRLFVGDWQLALARAELQLPPQDDEWDIEFAVPQPPFLNREKAIEHLTQAEQHYRDLFGLAASEDERLETDHYTQTLNGRMERVHALRAPLEAI